MVPTDSTGPPGESRLRRRRALIIVAVALTVCATLAGGVVAALTTEGAHPRGAAAHRGTSPGAQGPVTNVSGGQAGAFKRAVPPDLLAVAARPITATAARKIAKLRGVRDVIVVGGGAVQLQGRKVNAFAVEPSRFRSWTPPGTAKQEELWSALVANRFVVSSTAAQTLGIRAGLDYPIVARTMPLLTMGGAGSLGLPGIDMLVSRKTGVDLGLVQDLAVMINAPGANLRTLSGQMHKTLGAGAQVLNLHDQSNQVAGDGGGRAASYLDLYRQAATACPGLSWTVLAAIGQIESGHGRNAGRSSAGALGPMQFMPATWRAYGVDGDGDHKADIMNPYDAVPGAARYLCANGAGRGGKSLYGAVFRYNHADWYVRNVLSLARAYARQYS
ncbi:MAG: Lytic transglycosylase catalytic [Streptosporangiaceae bacterium]|nr:Lytic transglycosylase catalytic [Streptosporangiaceae bacterium]